MVKPQLTSDTPISMVGLRKELEAVKSHDKELNFRAQKTEEYLQQFCSLDEKKTAELYEKLVKLNVPRLKDQHICKIIDLLPKTVDELKVVLQGHTITVNNENLARIAETVSSVVK